MLRFVHISDTHLSHDPAYSVPQADTDPRTGARALVAQLNQLPFTPDLILHTGDVAADGVAADYDIARTLLQPLPAPIYYLNGNHDDSAHVAALMGRATQGAALYYEFEVNGVQFVCLDSAAPVNVYGAAQGFTHPRGYVDAPQLAWLAQVCRADDPRPLVVAVHHCVLPCGTPWLDDYMSIINGLEVHAALVPLRGRLRGVFHGHVHMSVDQYRDGILYTSALSSWYQLHAWPNQTVTQADTGIERGFNVVTITADSTHIRRQRYALG
jgi:3',5'-cyclic-AMP phosphodiesterase